MTHSFSITYLPCRSCHAKIHCDECEKRLEEALMHVDGVNGASIQIAAKQALIAGPIDDDTLEEAMEELGVFIT